MPIGKYRLTLDIELNSHGDAIPCLKVAKQYSNYIHNTLSKMNKVLQCSCTPDAQVRCELLCTKCGCKIDEINNVQGEYLSNTYNIKNNCIVCRLCYVEEEFDAPRIKTHREVFKKWFKETFIKRRKRKDRKKET